MKRADLPARDAEIERMFAGGLRPSDIARHVNLTTNQVRLVLKGRGLNLTPPNTGTGMAEEWKCENEDRRRELIIRRAASGARRTREANERTDAKRASVA